MKRVRCSIIPIAVNHTAYKQVFGNRVIAWPPAVVQQDGRTKQARSTVVHVVGSMHDMQYHINSHKLAACPTYFSIAIRAHLVQQPGLLCVADAVYLSH